MASLYNRFILPRLICWACSAPGIHAKRVALIPQAQGRVLELGCGGGLNFPFYERARVSSVAGVDPSPPLLRTAQLEALKAAVPIEVAAGKAEAVPYGDGEFDTVVLTFTLCSVQDPRSALAEVRRVLKPNGRLLFANTACLRTPAYANCSSALSLSGAAWWAAAT